MGLKFRRGTNAQKSGSLAFGEPYVNTDLGTLQIGGLTGDITLGASGTGSAGSFSSISGSGLDITGNANIAGNLTLGGAITIGDATADTVNVVASLSSSLIPQTTNAFDLGSANKIWKDLYISTGSIKFVEGTTVVKTLSAATLTALESSTGGAATTGSNIFNGSQTISGSLISNQKATFANQFGTALEISGGVEINNGFSYPVVIKDNLVVSGSVTLGGSSANTIDVSGSLKIREKATIGSSATQYGTGLEVSGAIDINNESMYPVTIKNNLVVSGSTILGDNSADSIEISGSLKTKEKATIGSSTTQYGTGLEITGAVDINNESNYPVSIKNNLVVSGSTILGDNSADSIEISGSFKTKEKATIGSSTTQYGTALEVTGAVVINNESPYPVSIKNNLDVTGSISASNIVATTGIYGNIYSTNGVVSGSSQVSYTGLSNIPNGIISSSAQIDTLFNIDGLVSASAQIDVASTTGDIALGTRTSGNYVTSLVAGTNITLSNNSGEGATPTIGLTNNAITIAGQSTALGSSVTADTIRVAIGTIVTGSSQIDVASTTGDIALGTRTSGSYVASLVAGTGITLSNNSGENATPTIAIGQSVATNATPTFGNLTINGSINATGDITAYYTSDKRHKNNIQPIENALLKVSKLNGVTWEWNDDVHEITKSTPKTGLIAQEVQEVLPEVIKEREDGFLALDYSKMMGLMVEAIKEQQSQIHNLTLEIENLKKVKGL